VVGGRAAHHGRGEVVYTLLGGGGSCGLLVRDHAGEQPRALLTRRARKA
jgi:hypothetical protein